MKPLCLIVLLFAASLAALPAASGDRPFGIEVVDEATGRGVPMVELRTPNEVRFLTDSGGLAAIDEPGFAGRTVHFLVSSPGYEFAADGFGFRGKALQVERGKIERLTVKRTSLAERLYRITGEGIYRDTVLLGRKPPIKEPLLNGQVFGCDSTQNAIYQGKLFWIWGDTQQAAYPLGNFHATGATSALPGKGGLSPETGVDLDYFLGEKGFVRGMAPMPGEGPTWLDALTVLEENGRERLFARYAKIRGQLETYERGVVRFNDEKGLFEFVQHLPLNGTVLPFGHVTRRKDGGVDYLYFGDPFPIVRVRADAAAFKDASQYEAYTCARPGSKLPDPEIERDGQGVPQWAWRKDAPPLGAEEQSRLVKQRTLKPEQAPLVLWDAERRSHFVIHRGTVNWNAFRKRWIMLAGEIGGKPGFLGEVWFAEAENPQGPWSNVTKVATHGRYSFYNPVHHPEFDQNGGKTIYFEGTYTRSFAGEIEPTPRYEYNQLMYRLDLADPRLARRS